MKEMLMKIVEFCNSYGIVIALGLLAFILILVVVLCSRKFPLNILSKIREIVPGVIKAAEATLLKGDAKLAFAVDLIQSYLLKAYPKLDVDKYTRFIKECIEEILSTPSKKGE